MKRSFVHVHRDIERFAAAVGVLFHSCVTGGLSETRVVQSLRKAKGKKAITMSRKVYTEKESRRSKPLGNACGEICGLSSQFV